MDDLAINNHRVPLAKSSGLRANNLIAVFVNFINQSSS